MRRPIASITLLFALATGLAGAAQPASPPSSVASKSAATAPVNRPPVVKSRDRPCLAPATPIGFAGYVFDPESCLYYAGARYYNPAVGRFTSPDPLAGDVMRPPSLHRYLYSYANPTRYTDPDGRQAISAQADAETMALVWGATSSEEMRSAAIGRAEQEQHRAAVSLPIIAGAMIGGGIFNGLRTGWVAYRTFGIAGWGAAVAGHQAAPYAEAAVEVAAGIPNPTSLAASMASSPARAEAAEARLSMQNMDSLAVAMARRESAAAEVGTGTPSLVIPPNDSRAYVVTEGGRGVVLQPSTPPTASNAFASVSSRPTPRQSEIDVGATLGPNAREQISFKGGNEVKYGTPGSSRPDWCVGGCSIEVKNYDVRNSSGLINSVVGQALQRQQNLPQGMVQTVVIDIRGQVVSPQQRAAIRQEIVNQSNGAIVPQSVTFKTQ